MNEFATKVVALLIVIVMFMLPFAVLMGLTWIVFHLLGMAITWKVALAIAIICFIVSLIV